MLTPQETLALLERRKTLLEDDSARQGAERDHHE
jgi:hypothetical protein